jgi:hypothetical protein
VIGAEVAVNEVSTATKGSSESSDSAGGGSVRLDPLATARRVSSALPDRFDRTLFRGSRGGRGFRSRIRAA